MGNMVVNTKNKQIIIDYEEYLELVKYKEMIEEIEERCNYGSMSFTGETLVVRGASKIVELFEKSVGRKYIGIEIKKNC